MDEIFEAAARDWLAAAGRDGTYHSLSAGPVTLDPVAGRGVVIERDVEVMGEGGVYSRQAMAIILSGLLKPKTGDWIEIGADRWAVEGLESDDGYLMRLFVRPKL
jgi:hypothetical protein